MPIKVQHFDAKSRGLLSITYPFDGQDPTDREHLANVLRDFRASPARPAAVVEVAPGQFEVWARPPIQNAPAPPTIDFSQNRVPGSSYFREELPDSSGQLLCRKQEPPASDSVSERLIGQIEAKQEPLVSAFCVGKSK